MNDNEPPWRLIAPAKDSKSAREISGAFVSELELVAAQLGLRCTRDDKLRKLYLDLPGEATQQQNTFAGGLVYPSGSVAVRHSQNNDRRYAPARSAAAPLVKVTPDIQVSKHFRLGEFRPKSSAYDGVRVHPDLVELLERIRSAVGGSIHITSGYRPPDYNASVGGASDSYHMDGFAADIYCDHLTTSQLNTVCERVVGNTGGLGYYPTQGFCHVDVRGYRSRWQG